MSSFLLKIVAIITMTIDHVAVVFFNKNLILRKIGRIAMPIFAFQVGVGFQKTSAKLKYILRMFLVAIISELPFLFMLKTANINKFSLNICFTFTFALLILYLLELAKKNKLFYVISLFPIILSFLLPMDYGIYGVALVILSYYFQNKKFLLSYGIISTAIIYYLVENNTIQLYMLLVLPFLWLYNGKKGKNLKYFFYAFYPLHMLLLSWIHFYLNF